jgi:hypothetical protein
MEDYSGSRLVEWKQARIIEWSVSVSPLIRQERLHRPDGARSGSTTLRDKEMLVPLVPTAASYTCQLSMI